MEYTVRYGIEFDPFLKNSKDTFINTSEYDEVKTRLDTLFFTKGIGLITGEPGKGKTTSIRKYIENLNKSLYKVFYTSFSTLTANEFYRNLTVELGIEPSARKSDNLRAIQQEVIRLSSDKNRTPVIIIDEADHMDSRALTDLQICFNFEMDSRDKAIVLLCGHPNINHQLKLNVHNALCQRIIMNYNMEGLSKNEGRRYITEKLKEAGSTRDIFDANAVEAIVNGSDGTPRMMNKYCSRAMMIGNIEAKDEIDADIARKAINDCTLG